MNDFNIKKFLVENKMTRNSRLLSENVSREEEIKKIIDDKVRQWRMDAGAQSVMIDDMPEEAMDAVMKKFRDEAESELGLNEAATTPESATWLLVNELIAHYGFDGSFEDGIYTSPQGFKFKDMGDKIVAELQYGDYGSSREEGEAALDPLVGELEDELNRIGFPYKITTTSRAYFIAINAIDDDMEL